MSHRRIHRMASVLTAGLLTVGFLAYPGSPSGAEEEATVRMQLFGFDPDRLEIRTGTTVTWLNDEVFDYPVADGTHRIVADDESFDSGELQPRQSFTMRFLDPGTISYVCAVHPALMSGDLVITGPPVKPEPTRKDVSIVEPNANVPDSWGYEPADVTVDAGTTIVWRNSGAQVHTVTASDGSFDSGNLGPGESFTRTFDEPVTVRYACTPHPWMTAIVRVAGAGGAPPPPPPPSGGGSGGGETPDIEQPDREGNEPATFNVLAVEPDPASPFDWGFEPKSLSIRAGDTIVWRNAGATVHTVTASDGSFDSGNLDPDATFSRTFDTPVTINYACTPHPWMKGTILVVPASTDGELPTAPPPVEEPGGPGGGPGTEVPQPRGEDDLEADPAAAVRTPLAVGTGGLAVLLGLILILPTLLERSRRRVVPLEVAEEPAERERVDALR